MSDLVERVALAIYQQPTTMDGDSVGTRLGESWLVDTASRDAADMKRIVMGICRDAAKAAIEVVKDHEFETRDMEP